MASHVRNTSFVNIALMIGTMISHINLDGQGVVPTAEFMMCCSKNYYSSPAPRMSSISIEEFANCLLIFCQEQSLN